MSGPESIYLPPTPADVAVVICAYTEERWDDIVDAVESVLGQSEPPGEVALVIDHNPSLLEKARSRFGGDIQILENRHRQGLSGARNSGIEATSAPIVAFLDDDARAQPGWLAELARAYEDPSVAGAGGFIAPDWQTSRPSWWPHEFDWVIGCSYLGQPTKRTVVRNPIGANMSVRRSAFEHVGGFNSALGRVGKHPVGAEETELFIRIHRELAGTRIMYEPLAAVSHRVGADRATFNYFRRRCYAEGLSKSVVSRLATDSENLSSEWSYTLKTLPLGVLGSFSEGLRGSRGGFGRAGAIVAGLAITTAGYMRGRAIKGPGPSLTEVPHVTEGQ